MYVRHVDEKKPFAGRFKVLGSTDAFLEAEVVDKAGGEFRGLRAADRWLSTAFVVPVL